MKIEITPVSLSPSSDFLQRQRDNIISYYIYERHYFMTYICRYMFINSEREIIMKIEVGPAELVSPDNPLFFRFPPDSLDTSILSGLVV